MGWVKIGEWGFRRPNPPPSGLRPPSPSIKWRGEKRRVYNDISKESPFPTRWGRAGDGDYPVNLTSIYRIPTRPRPGNSSEAAPESSPLHGLLNNTVDGGKASYYKDIGREVTLPPLGGEGAGIRRKSRPTGGNVPLFMAPHLSMGFFISLRPAFQRSRHFFPPCRRIQGARIELAFTPSPWGRWR